MIKPPTFKSKIEQIEYDIKEGKLRNDEFLKTRRKYMVLKKMSRFEIGMIFNF